MNITMPRNSHKLGYNDITHKTMVIWIFPEIGVPPNHTFEIIQIFGFSMK